MNNEFLRFNIGSFKETENINKVFSDLNFVFPYENRVSYVQVSPPTIPIELID